MLKISSCGNSKQDINGKWHKTAGLDADIAMEYLEKLLKYPEQKQKFSEILNTLLIYEQHGRIDRKQILEILSDQVLPVIMLHGNVQVQDNNGYPRIVEIEAEDDDHWLPDEDASGEIERDDNHERFRTDYYGFPG